MAISWSIRPRTVSAFAFENSPEGHLRQRGYAAKQRLFDHLRRDLARALHGHKLSLRFFVSFIICLKITSRAAGHALASSFSSSPGACPSLGSARAGSLPT